MGESRDLAEFECALARLPDGYIEGVFVGRRWSATLRRSEDSRGPRRARRGRSPKLGPPNPSGVMKPAVEKFWDCETAERRPAAGSTLGNGHRRCARYAGFEFFQASGKAEIARLEDRGLDEHIARSREPAVADVTVGPMVKIVDPLDGRKAMAELREELVCPGGMAGNRRDCNLIEPHRSVDSNLASEPAQASEVVRTASVKERQAALCSREGTDSAMPGHRNRHEACFCLQRRYFLRMPAVDGMERIVEEIGASGRMIVSDPHIGMEARHEVALEAAIK